METASRSCSLLCQSDCTNNRAGAPVRVDLQKANQSTIGGDVTEFELRDLWQRTCFEGCLSPEIRIEIEAAIKWLRDEGEPRVAFWRGRFVYEYFGELGLRNTSISDFTEALWIDPTDLDSRYLLACSLFDSLRYKEAATQFREVISDSRLYGPDTLWRALKAKELLAVSLLETGHCGEKAAVLSWYPNYAKAKEEDRPVPLELRRALKKRGCDLSSEFPLLYEGLSAI